MPPPNVSSKIESARVIAWLSAKGLSLLGDALFQIALPLIVLQKTNSSRLMGYTVATELTAYTVFAILGGYLSDRYSLKRLIVGLDLARFAALVGILLLLDGSFSYSLLLVLTFILSMLSAVYNVAHDTFAVHAFTGPRLERVLTLNQTLDSLAGILGFAVSWVLLALAPLELCLWLDAFSFLLPPVVLLLFPHVRPATSEKAATNGFKTLFSGFTFSWQHPAIRHTLTLAMLGNILSAIWAAQALILMKTHWHMADHDVGLFQAALSLGFVLGVSIFGRLAKTRRLTLFGILILGQYLQAAFFFALGFDFQIVWIVVIAVLYSASQAGHTVPSALIRKEHTPKAVYGQALAAARVLSRLTAPVAMYASLIVLDWISYSTLFLGAALLVAALSLPSVFGLLRLKKGGLSPCPTPSTLG